MKLLKHLLGNEVSFRYINIAIKKLIPIRTNLVTYVIPAEFIHEVD